MCNLRTFETLTAKIFFAKETAVNLQRNIAADSALRHAIKLKGHQVRRDTKSLTRLEKIIFIFADKRNNVRVVNQKISRKVIGLCFRLCNHIE